MMQSVLTFFLDGKAPQVYNKDSDRSAGSVFAAVRSFRQTASLCRRMPRRPRDTAAVSPDGHADAHEFRPPGSSWDSEEGGSVFSVAAQVRFPVQAVCRIQNEAAPACGRRIPHRAANRPLKTESKSTERTIYGKKTKQQGPRDDARRPE